MPQVPPLPPPPPLSPQWPPNADQMAEIARALHWELDQLAYDLSHRPHAATAERRQKIAADLAAFADLLRRT